GAVTAGALPPGLALSTGGVISGAPLLPGTYNFTVTVTDHIGAQASKALSITVAAGPLVILTTALPPGRLGQPYAAQFTASGGVQPYHWTLISGSLPPGLTLNDDGSVTGKLLAAGAYPSPPPVTGRNATPPRRASCWARCSEQTFRIASLSQPLTSSRGVRPGTPI